MPDIPAARPRRPARRGCRGGVRARQARGTRSSDHPTAPGTGAPDGPCRVECRQTPANQTAQTLSASASHQSAQSDDRLTSGYDHGLLLAVRDQLSGDVADGVKDTILRSLPAHLSHLIRRRWRPVLPLTENAANLAHRQSGAARAVRATSGGSGPVRSKGQRPSQNELVIGHINIRSLIPNMDSVLDTLQTYNIDVLCLTETWLADPITDRVLVFPGYRLVRRDRPAQPGCTTSHRQRGGGVAILYRECLNVTVLNITSDGAACESLWVSVAGKGHRSTTVGVVYRPPSQSLSDGLNSLQNQLHDALILGKVTFCLGDLNIDLLRPDGPGVRRYWSILNDLSLFQLVKTATHLSPSETLLDHIITNVPNLETSIQVPPVPIADHRTVIVRAPFRRLRHRPSPFSVRPWRKTNWDALCLELLLTDWGTVYGEAGIDSKVAEFLRLWWEAVDVHCPMKTIFPRRPYCPWLEDNPELRALMSQRDEAHRVWRETRTHQNLETYRTLRNRVKGSFARSKRDFLCSYLLSDRTSFWRGIKHFSLRAPKITEDLPGSLTPQRADDFNRHFVSVGPRVAAEMKAINPAGASPPPRPPRVTASYFTLRPVTLPELSKALSDLSSSKAVGIDGVPIDAVRKCFPVVGPHILHIINTSIATCIFPSSWKIASVVPLHKAGSRDSASNFRPISILSVLSKLTEKVICGQLLSYLTANELLSSSQYAYRAHHSTEDALLDMIDWVSRRIDGGHIVAATSIDLSKAFDSVDHEILLEKLQWYGVDPRWFRSYLADRRQVVRGGSLSLSLSHGVPQGSILGPILFSLFTNDLPSYLPHGRLISYADDTQLLDSAHPDELNLLKTRQEETIGAVLSYFTSNRMKMNPAKTTLLLLGTNQSLKKASSFHVNISGHNLNPSSSVKILGVTVDGNLTWDNHISNVAKKCNSILFCLYKIRHHLTPEALKLLIETHVFPHILYCISVWGGAASCHLNRLQKIINFAARIVSGTRKYDHISPTVKALGWHKIRDLVVYRDILSVFRALHNPIAPLAIRSLFAPRSTISHRVTRATTAGTLQLPPFRLSLTRRTFSYRAAMSWNCLPSTISGSPSRAELIRRLDMHAVC